MYDLIIIGGGPAGVAAGVYASRKRLKTALIACELSGQSAVSEDVQNWIGTVSIPGSELAENMKKHLHAYAEDVVDIIEGEKIKTLSKSNDDFIAVTENGKEYKGKNVLIASGANRRKLTVPGADIFEHKGLTYCASCDGPVFSGQDVVVIGGGNAGFETAAQLLAYTKSVTLLCRKPVCKADPVTVKKVSAHPNMTVLTESDITEVKGDGFVTGISYKDIKTGEVKDIQVNGVFVEIGNIPSTDFVKDVVKLDDFSRIITDPKNQQTSTPGIWAAGDVTDELYHQNNIAAGDAVKAVEDIYQAHAAR
ncbi:FAD-dependent oxidoreductase [bacterium]|jgi:NADH-dependent peroxiredoxin subunit F|nr:FAD-dependent oxidoreductase [bacterium]MBT3730002.1 FAD-dependent oxidoreductase [bacterium]MBT4894546.1 FAD-dependent oxidoreductase [bacterium]